MLAAFASEGAFLLAGGAFILRRVPAAASTTAARGLSTSSHHRCNEPLSLDEAPFGQALPPEYESEEDEVMSATVGGTVLFGQSKVRDWASAVSKPPTAASLGPARWIGSTTHSGDYTRASVKQPVASSGDTVWGQIVSACRADPTRLQATVAALYASFEQTSLTPPLPAFNKLLELCTKNSADPSSVHKLIHIMDNGKLAPNEETRKHLEAAFAYNSPTNLAPQ